MMNREITTLQIEPHDDQVTIRDMLAFVETPRVLIMLPSGHKVLHRKLDLLLIQRQALRLGLELALITGDAVVMDYARELNLSVFSDEQAAVRERWKQPRRTLFDSPHNPHKQAAIVRHVAAQRGGTASTLWGRRRQRAGRWLMLALLVGSLLAGVVLAVPSATVSLRPASRQVFESVTVVADPALTDIDIETFSMPAAVVSLEATARVTVQTVGRERAGATLAQGLVTFANSADEPLLIPLGTVVATSGTFPIRFATILEATLPAGSGSRVQVPVQAMEAHAGPTGNVDPETINRIEADFAETVSVINANATYGGAVQEQPVVTADDHQRLLVLGRQQVLQNARDVLLLQLSGDQFLVPGSVVVVQERPEWTLYSHVIGDIAESVSLDLRAQVQAVVVDERQARQVAYSGLAPYIQPGLEISQEALRFSRGDILSIEPNGRVTFVMIVSGNIAVAIDEDQVRDRVVGARVSEARARLEREMLLDPQAPPQIKTWPEWFNRLPLLPVRITVEIQTP